MTMIEWPQSQTPVLFGTVVSVNCVLIAAEFPNHHLDTEPIVFS